ncbi:MAG: MerR family transcriptional regulator [Lachnospiraceae bacterium]|jgi:DNA-binding transcriptional MerR regulator|nr:MerR family transcriptional regulator [Lachnospiraceae bacterium]MCI9133122.1 MerR family transcriptional regulator [Lachnospiraceae bacterium]
MLYTVGEIAKVLGVPASTLRYYDKEGLLPFVERSSGGIRMFSQKDYEWLKVIECLKQSGLSIREIRNFIHMAMEGDSSLSGRLELFQTRRDAVKKQLEDMQETLALLEYKCWYYEQAMKDGTEEKVRSLSPEELPQIYREIQEKIKNIHINQ